MHVTKVMPPQCLLILSQLFYGVKLRLGYFIIKGLTRMCFCYKSVEPAQPSFCTRWLNRWLNHFLTYMKRVHISPEISLINILIEAIFLLLIVSICFLVDIYRNMFACYLICALSLLADMFFTINIAISVLEMHVFCQTYRWFKHFDMFCRVL